MTARRLSSLSALAVAALIATAHAQIPQMIAYQGRVAAGGVNFHGTGQFKFAIVRGNYGGAPGEPLNLWSNDGSLASTDNTGAPTAAVSVACDRGLYSVLLGNTAAGMVAVPPSVFANPDVRLRVWFNDGTRGWQKLTPDQRLVSVGYAMMADSATTAQTAQTVADGAITTAKLANNSITAAKMTPGSVTSAALANGSVTVGSLADGSVTNSKLAAGAVTTASILDGTITSADIFDGTIGTTDLANGAVTAAKIAGDTITAAEIAPAAVTNSELAPGAVGTQQIQTGAVRSLEILDGSVGASDLAASAVTAAKVAVNTLTAAEIAASAITPSELADGAVTSTKLAVDAVTTAAIAPGAVGSAEIAGGAVQLEDLALNSVATAHVVDGTIQTTDLADKAVTLDKLATGLTTVLASASVSIPQLAPGSVGGAVLVPWATETVDSGNFHAAGSSRITAPRNGVYLLTANLTISQGSLVSNSLRVLKNAGGLQFGGTIVGREFVSDSPYVNFSAVVALNAGDYLEVWAETARTTGSFVPTWVETNSGFSLTCLSNLP